jgi:hypothetical protein
MKKTRGRRGDRGRNSGRRGALGVRPRLGVLRRRRGVCRTAPGAVIHYGRRGAFAHRRSPPRGVPCTNEVFGDPVVGVPKQCFLSRDCPLRFKARVESAAVAADSNAARQRTSLATKLERRIVSGCCSRAGSIRGRLTDPAVEHDRLI